MNCGKCQRDVKETKGVKCSRCYNVFHILCGGLTAEDYKTMNSMNKANWKCPPCKIDDPRSMRSDLQSKSKLNPHQYTNTPSSRFLTPPNNASPDISSKNNDQLLKRIEDTMLKIKSDIQGDLQEAHRELLHSLNLRIEANNRKCDELKKENSKILEAVNFITQQHDEAMGKLKELEPLRHKCEELSKRNQLLEDKIEQLENKFDDMDQITRRKNLEFRNVPEAKDENLTEVLTKIGSVINCPIQPRDVQNIYRVSSKVPTGKRRAIIAKFSTTFLRDKFLKAVNSYNKSAKTKDCKLNSETIHLFGKTPIFISEHLTIKTKRLYAEVRKFSAENNFKYTWTSFGKIFIRKDDNSKMLQITSSQCLGKLL